MGKEIEGEHWREWLKEWGDHFLLFARQQSPTKSEAEDILQETFIKVYEKIDTFDVINIASGRGYLLRDIRSFPSLSCDRFGFSLYHIA